jgi:hypothetical protein
MGAVFLTLMFAAVSAIVVGLLSTTACHIAGGAYSKRVSALYFWTGLGLVYGLWLIWCGLAIFVEELRMAYSESTYGIATSMMVLSPIMYVLCAIRGIRDENRCKSVWVTVAVFVIGVAAVPSIYALVASLSRLQPFLFVP